MFLIHARREIGFTCIGLRNNPLTSKFERNDFGHYALYLATIMGNLPHKLNEKLGIIHSNLRRRWLADQREFGWLNVNAFDQNR